MKRARVFAWLLAIVMLLSAMPSVALAVDYGEWSDWSTTKPTGQDGREIEERESTAGYNMVHYLTMGNDGRRQYRSYSVNGDYATYGLSVDYGEFSRTWYATKAEIDSADTCSEGDYVNYADNTAGYNMGSGTAYAGWNVRDCLVWFIKSEVKQTEYRYRDAIQTEIPLPDDNNNTSNQNGTSGYEDEQRSDTYNANWEKEDNNTIVTANNIPLNTTISGNLSSKGDVDWYTFSVPSAGMVQLSFNHEYIDNSGNFWCTWLSTGEQKIAECYWAGNATKTLTSQKVGLGAGIYYLIVQDYYHSDITYQLSVDFTPSDTWEKELNNTIVSATSIQLDKQYSGSISNDYDIDWYQFTLDADKSIQISFDHTYIDNYNRYWNTVFYTYDNKEISNTASYWKGNETVSQTSEKYNFKAGTYYLRISDYYHSSIPYSFSLNSGKYEIPATAISLDKSELKLKKGETATLSASLNPSNATDEIIWSSSDTKVATISNGKVNAIEVGTATITAKAGSVSATCKVTVSSDAVSIAEISLDKTSVTLKAGESTTLTATVSPSNATDKTVTWSSSNTGVATVSGGKVTAVSEGSATITAKAGDKTASCSVKVDKNVIVVSEISLSRSSITLKTGESATLSATVSPSNATDKNVTWSSSDTSVATVSDGKVSATGEGSATITATAGDKSATCTVKVEKNVVSATGVTISQTSLTLKVGESATLSASVSPTNATDKTVTWSSSDSNIAKVNDGKVTAVSEGSATIKAAAGKVSTICTVTVTKDKTENQNQNLQQDKPRDQPNSQPKTEAPADIHFDRVTVYYQDQFSDVPANQWFTNTVADAYEFGLMKGTSKKEFNPYGDVTISQAITMAARIHSLYTTGTENFDQSEGSAWYYTYMNYALKNGIINQAYYNSDVSNKATRAQFAEIFANSLPTKALPAINQVVDGAIPDVAISARYAEYVYKLYRAGILTGSDANGTFNPSTYITRAEAAAIVSRMAESNNRVSISLYP